jgi:hypothetical protein
MNSKIQCKTFDREWNIFEFWDFDQIMANEPMNQKLRSMGFFTISLKFLIDRIPFRRIWDFGRIGE